MIFIQYGARLRARDMRRALLGTACAMVSAGAALAQAAAPPADAGAIKEVTVTARHRNESLQTVPIAVSVVDGDKAALKNLNDLGDIATSVPSVDFRTGASNKDRTLFIRGVGTITTSPGVEPSVSTVVDGVVLARPGEATFDLSDLDRVEVLRGPQGTLFGKNASAGVINIITKNPTADPHGYIDGAWYEGNEYRLKAGASGALIADKLEGVVSVFDGKYDGNVRNAYNGQKINGYDHQGGRIKLVATPIDKLTITVGADYTHSLEKVPTGVFASTNRITYPTGVVVANPTLASALANSGVTASADNRTVSNNLVSTVHDRNAGFSGQIDYDLGAGYKLTSITGYRTWRNTQEQDYDQLSKLTTSFPQGADRGDLYFNQTSEELRIASPKGGLIDYVAGVYYLHAFDREIYERDISTLSGATQTNTTGIAHYGTTGNNYSVFGEANFNLTKSLRLIAGYREIWDTLDFHENRVSTSAVAVTGVRPNFSASGSTDATGYSDRLGVQYDLTSQVHTYFTYSRGYKGPAFNAFFNMQATDTKALLPETSNAYEIGLKGRFLDGRVQANLAGFITDFDNYQANFTDTVGGALVTRLINAGSVSTQGIEGDVTARPIDNLNITFAFARTDAKVDQFNCPVGAPTSCNINGQTLPFAPKWKLNTEADYTIPLRGPFDVGLEADYGWQSRTQYSLGETQDTIQAPYGILNGSVSLIGRQGWRVQGLVKNILDQHYSSYLAYGNLGGVVRWVPRDDNRYFGIDVRKDF